MNHRENFNFPFIAADNNSDDKLQVQGVGNQGNRINLFEREKKNLSNSTGQKQNLKVPDKSVGHHSAQVSSVHVNNIDNYCDQDRGTSSDISGTRLQKTDPQGRARDIAKNSKASVLSMPIDMGEDFLHSSHPPHNSNLSNSVRPSRLSDREIRNFTKLIASVTNDGVDSECLDEFPDEHNANDSMTNNMTNRGTKDKDKNKALNVSNRVGYESDGERAERGRDRDKERDRDRRGLSGTLTSPRNRDKRGPIGRPNAAVDASLGLVSVGGPPHSAVDASLGLVSVGGPPHSPRKEKYSHEANLGGASSVSRRSESKALNSPRSSSLPVPGKPDIEYLDSVDVLPCSAPAKEMPRALHGLDVHEWPEIFSTINTIRAIALHHGDLLVASGSLHTVVVHLVRHVDSLRSAVAKNSILAIGDILTGLKQKVDQDLNAISGSLIKRYADSSTFLGGNAADALIKMIENSTATKSLAVLATLAAEHKNANARGKAALIISQLLSLKGAELAGTRELVECLLRSRLSKLLIDQSPETRVSAREIVNTLLEAKIVSSRGALEQFLSGPVIDKVQLTLSKAYTYDSRLSYT